MGITTLESKMYSQELLAFFVFAFTAAVTPGPSNVLVMTAGVQGGFLGGLRCLFGVVAGMALMMATAVAGLGGVISGHPTALLILKWAGSAFLLWLAWKVANAPPMRQDAKGEVIGFWKALAFQWVNPKSWIVSASAAATYGNSLPGSVFSRATAIALTFGLAATIACSIWMISGAALKQWLGEEKNSRLFNRSMGLLLAASTVMIHV